MNMFSKELLQLDRNTVQFMIDEMQDEIDSQKVQIQERDAEIDNQKAQLQEKDIRIAKLLEEKLGKPCSPANLSSKLIRGTLTYNEVALICDILQYNIEFKSYLE